MTAPKQRVPDPMLLDLRAAMEGAKFNGNRARRFVLTHGPALLARLEGCGAADLEERDWLDKRTRWLERSAAIRSRTPEAPR